MMKLNSHRSKLAIAFQYPHLLSYLFLILSFTSSSRLFADPYWGEFQEGSCTQVFPGKKQYSAVLWDIPSGVSWEESCAATGAEINGYFFDSPERCVNTLFNIWGEFAIPAEECEVNWAAPVGFEYHTHQDDGCAASDDFAGLHKYSSRLWNIPDGYSWEVACEQASMMLSGRLYQSPHRCVNEGAAGIWGEWYIPDSQCEASPLKYQRGLNDALKLNEPLPGFADLHTHLMSHLGFGGVIFHGEPYGAAETALAPGPSGTEEDDEHADGHSRVEAILQDDIVGAALNTATHERDGFPEFNYWPAFDSLTHQAMYYQWVKRAYEGGLRAMVVLAVNGDFMFGATDNGLPDIIKGIAIASNPTLDLSDMNTLRRQTQAVYEMQYWIDAKFGGLGKGWFRVVTTPEDARSVIADGKLAVILGSEVDYLLDCEPNDCSVDNIEQGVNALYDLGLRYIFPVHLKTNGFGGEALYNFLTGGESYDCKHYSKDCNALGLTDAGRQLITLLMKKGMIIDVGHMSARSLNDTLTLAEANHYPAIVTGHTGVYDMSHADNRHEANPPGNALKRIVDLGGMIGLILGQGNLNQVGEWHDDTGRYIPHACGGTSQTFLQSYRYLKNLLGEQSYQGAITIGSDFNGFAHMPGPRFGDDACPGGKTSIAQTEESRVAYPYSLDSALIPANTWSSDQYRMEQYQFFERTYDYNTDGAAHIGLLPDFFEDLRQQGLSRSDLEPIYRSAGFLVEMWQSAVRQSQIQSEMPTKESSFASYSENPASSR